jgi:hypothetical protein
MAARENSLDTNTGVPRILEINPRNDVTRFVFERELNRAKADLQRPARMPE